MARITKLELTQSNDKLMAENSALRAEVQALRTQLKALSAKPAAMPVARDNMDLAQLAKHFAKKYHCVTKIENGVLLYKDASGEYKRVHTH